MRQLYLTEVSTAVLLRIEMQDLVWQSLSLADAPEESYDFCS